MANTLPAGAHAPAGGAPGKRAASDIELHARDLDRDFYMTPEQAREYGIVDEVLEASGRATA